MTCRYCLRNAALAALYASWRAGEITDDQQQDRLVEILSTRWRPGT